ncbi:uncharacterized protein LOC113495407 isoform X2 [Trichoplusia ni]|uniref:Uncharacterized protein LOC113495407 isoform X2 n=1 Tax=Trichoplusia ni TaxID=7111 RepID=A0A7E5VNL4_TRINI|nr:uncharacterized protein LOC113495407 isoform X2 [Trichoplusia ni]
MNTLYVSVILLFLLSHVSGYWDTGTTTAAYIRTDLYPRQSFFRWQMVQSERLRLFFSHWDWTEIRRRRRLNCVAGISIDLLCLGTAVLLNRRTLITSANYLDPWMNRMRDVRIWALGRGGYENMPYRYRVWRITRLFPKSLNPEHWHGPRGIHSPRHDVSVIHSLDQIYIMAYPPTRYHLPYRCFLCGKHHRLSSDLWFTGSGYEYLLHIKENYKIFFAMTPKKYIVDCSKYLPKWWGKFICIKNYENLPGVPNGGALFDGDHIVGIGCFEIRYNEDRIMVFTDLRYYMDWVYLYAEISPGEYYEYAYPQWGQNLGWFFDGFNNYPYIPWWQVRDDFYPMGKKK